jgi:hypothetical protein
MKTLTSLALALVACCLRAADTPVAKPGPAPVAGFSEPACFDGRIRISALLSAGGKVRVGIVETASKASYLVSPGERAGDVEVVSADYEKELVVLRRGNDICTLNLSSDPDAVQPALNLLPPAEKVYRGEAIEAFLRDNPDAEKQGLIKFPLPVMPPAVGKGEGIERFLRENPDLARKADQPVVGRGEGIESYLKAHPEIKVFEGTIPEGSFGPGIDAALKAQPGLLTNSAPGIPLELRKPPARTP